jgi:signal transduction histidine kinase/CheY-like chemotaxis protein/HAMP domain-containing protein
MMNLKNIKIGTQLQLGFITLLLLVIVLGIVAYIQADRIQEQTGIIFTHPMEVQRSIGRLHKDIFNILEDMDDALLSDSENEIAENVNLIETWKADASDQIDTLYSHYLGSITEIDSLKNSFIRLTAVCDETIRLIHDGNIKEAASRNKDSGINGRQAEMVLNAINTINTFSINKGNELYRNSLEMHASLNRRLVIILILILFLIVFINYAIIRNIRKPINELSIAAKKFQDGDMNARSSYNLKNEFGDLSVSFNSLVENIQEKTDLEKKVASLAELMLSEYDIKKFFLGTLNAMASYTNSHMAAIYLLSEDKKSFDHFESIGTDNNARQSFDAVYFEGEFGTVLSTQKIHHIRNIPGDTRFAFYTVSGKFFPSEIITIPIIADNEVVAIISLASIAPYSKQSVLLVENIHMALCARIEGILAYHKIKEFSKKLESQNLELEARKAELSAQSVELIEQNTELEMQKKQLFEASRLKTNFLSNMSHELRTPLNSVIALSGVLNRRLAGKIEEEEYSYLDVIERNGKRLLALINDILDISRIESGRQDMEIAPFNANSLIAEAVGMIMPQAKQNNTELHHNDSQASLLLTSDADKCRHILQNLIGNAVKFTENGKVEVAAHLVENGIAITVKDSGIGIAEDQLEHIFDEFRQADSSTSRRFGGTGLGLALARKYATMLGGTISVKSTVGLGSEFTLSLPLRYEPVTLSSNTTYSSKPWVPLKHAPPADPGSKTPKSILLVEDNEPAIIQMKDILAETGFTLLIAHDGTEAMKILEDSIPDAIILDLMMPGIDGFEVLRLVRESERTFKVPVLILSSKYVTKDELAFLKGNNIYQLIRKGDVNRNELLNAMTGMLYPQAMPGMKSKKTPLPAGNKPIVLVVEDNPDNMVTVRALLAGNYTVIEATDGHMGVEMAKKHKPDLILMDIRIPGIDGIQALKAIRHDPGLEQSSVIALTASALTQDREAILAHGFDAYIGKPIDEQLFFRTINETLYGN